MKLTTLFCMGLALTFLICTCCTLALAQDEAAISPEAKSNVENATNSLAEEMTDLLTSSETTNMTEIYGLLRDQLRDNPDVFGAAFAFAPVEEDGKQVLAAPYVYRDGDEIIEKDPSAIYNYLESEWYTEPVRLGLPMWSEPYYDETGAGANVLMITYSVPIYTTDDAHRLLGVVTGDLLIEKGP